LLNREEYEVVRGAAWGRDNGHFILFFCLRSVTYLLSGREQNRREGKI